MGNEIYQVCSCKDSIENPLKEKVKLQFINYILSAYQTRPQNPINQILKIQVVIIVIKVSSYL